MLDPDISTADAKRLLSQPGDLDDIVGPNGWTRRKFLQAVGGGVLGGAALGSFGTDRFGLGKARPAHAGSIRRYADRCSRTASSSTSCLYGGKRWSQHGRAVHRREVLRHPWPGQRQTWRSPPAQLLPLDATFGLHPSLTYTKRLWGRRATGHRPWRRLSQFPTYRTSTSMGDLDGRQVRRGPQAGTGWIGRWLDGQPAATGRPHGRHDRFVGFRFTCSVRRTARLRFPQKRPKTCSAPGPIRQTLECSTACGALSSSPAGRGPWHDMFRRRRQDPARSGCRRRPRSTNPAPSGDDFTQKDDSCGPAHQRQPRLPCARHGPRQLRHARWPTAEPRRSA